MRGGEYIFSGRLNGPWVIYQVLSAATNCSHIYYYTYICVQDIYTFTCISPRWFLCIPVSHTVSILLQKKIKKIEPYDKYIKQISMDIHVTSKRWQFKREKNCLFLELFHFHLNSLWLAWIFFFFSTYFIHDVKYTFFFFIIHTRERKIYENLLCITKQ